MKLKGYCLFYEGMTTCERCCNDCTQICPHRCVSKKKTCGGYIGFSNRYWGDWEKQQLLSMRRWGLTWKQSADFLGRSTASCKSIYRIIKRTRYLS